MTTISLPSSGLTRNQERQAWNDSIRALLYNFSDVSGIPTSSNNLDLGVPTEIPVGTKKWNSSAKALYIKETGYSNSIAGDSFIRRGIAWKVEQSLAAVAPNIANYELGEGFFTLESSNQRLYVINTNVVTMANVVDIGACIANSIANSSIVSNTITGFNIQNNTIANVKLSSVVNSKTIVNPRLTINEKGQITNISAGGDFLSYYTTFAASKPASNEVSSRPIAFREGHEQQGYISKTIPGAFTSIGDGGLGIPISINKDIYVRSICFYVDSIIGSAPYYTRIALYRNSANLSAHSNLYCNLVHDAGTATITGPGLYEVTVNANVSIGNYFLVQTAFNLYQNNVKFRSYPPINCVWDHIDSHLDAGGCITPLITGVMANSNTGFPSNLQYNWEHTYEGISVLYIKV